jgi:hypothetical protein
MDASRGVKRSNRTLKRQAREFAQKIPGIRTLSRKNCPPGMIMRKNYERRYSTAIARRGYTVKRKNGKTYRVHPKQKDTHVKSRCIKNLGNPGKAPAKIGPLRKGDLKKHGYSFRLNSATRHQALRKAVGEYGALGVFHKLAAVRSLTKATLPAASQVYEKDEKWVRGSFPFASNKR